MNVLVRLHFDDSWGELIVEKFINPILLHSLNKGN